LEILSKVSQENFSRSPARLLRKPRGPQCQPCCTLLATQARGLQRDRYQGLMQKETPTLQQERLLEHYFHARQATSLPLQHDPQGMYTSLLHESWVKRTH